MGAQFRLRGWKYGFPQPPLLPFRLRFKAGRDRFAGGVEHRRQAMGVIISLVAGNPYRLDVDVRQGVSCLWIDVANGRIGSAQINPETVIGPTHCVGHSSNTPARVCEPIF